MHAFSCHFVYLQSRIFTLRFGLHSEFGLYIPNNLNYSICHTSNQPPAHFPVLVSCNSVCFPLAPTLVRISWAVLSSRNFKFLYRLHGGLFPLSEGKTILISDAFTEAISTVNVGELGSLDLLQIRNFVLPSVTDIFTARIPARYQGRC